MRRSPEQAEIYLLFFLGIFVFSCLVGFIIYFIFVYRNKQLKNDREKDQMVAQYHQELLKTRIEIQEQTLKHISDEIHDNIGQVLSFIKLNLSQAKNLDSGQKQEKIDESRELISHVIVDLRNLSHSLSFEHIVKHGLPETIKNDVQTLQNTGAYDIDFIISGQHYSLDQRIELVLYRIFQEAINNIIKHSKAKHLKISLQYFPEMFNLTVEDDGLGFNAGEILKNCEGNGLKNIRNRASLIGASMDVNSSPNEGCQITISLNPSGNSQVNDNEAIPSGSG
ncbi:hypothetical protein GS399_14920 [Pedobacter sp. HMF7647]|uniref:histidine kinase n=1 Tax=Hufsiella arboris TaxID=2695275 RepID=A0A7K1YE09_9SPHI|nr:sensor histidine kinase [Hufsiella arboris]MXV52268.1 hypothetical protein [Hufsiella arboris]